MRIFSSLILILILHPESASTQDLHSDLRRVSQRLQDLENFSIRIQNYSTEGGEKETLVIKKCNENFYTSGYGQISCINRYGQIMLIPDEKIAVYSDSPEQQLSDPLQYISNLLNGAEEVTRLSSTSSVRKYVIQSSDPGTGTVEIWIDTSLWYVKKVIQSSTDLNGGIVFETVQFQTSCENSSIANLSTYCTVKNGRASLTESYKLYQLYHADDYMVRQ